MTEDAPIDVTFSAEELALIESVAAARGCTVSDFIARAALAGACEVLGLTGTRPEATPGTIDAHVSAHDG